MSEEGAVKEEDRDQIAKGECVNAAVRYMVSRVVEADIADLGGLEVDRQSVTSLGRGHGAVHRRDAVLRDSCHDRQREDQSHDVCRAGLAEIDLPGSDRGSVGLQRFVQQVSVGRKTLDLHYGLARAHYDCVCPSGLPSGWYEDAGWAAYQRARRAVSCRLEDPLERMD